MFSSNEPAKTLVNSNGVALVRLAEIHMTFVGLQIAKVKEKSFNCPTFVTHLRNLFAIVAIEYV